MCTRLNMYMTEYVHDLTRTRLNIYTTQHMHDFARTWLLTSTLSTHKKNRCFPLPHKQSTHARHLIKSMTTVVSGVQLNKELK